MSRKYFGTDGVRGKVGEMPITPDFVMKLGWAFGQTDDLEKVKEIMLTPIAGEITEREPSNGYLIYQGGLPEVEDFIKQYRK